MVALGIDFGTSTTVAALCSAGNVTFLSTTDEEEVVPSFVAFLPNGSVEVGSKARSRRMIDADNTVQAFKRIIGKPWFSKEVRDYRQHYGCRFEQGPENMPQFITRVGKLTAVEITGYLLNHLRESPSLTDVTLNAVTLSVPVSFTQEQQQAIRNAAARAGWHDVSLIDEPCAAAIAHTQNVTGDETVFVYDLGGGTFDTAILACRHGAYEVLAVGGDASLGGDDIDMRCSRWAAKQILENYRWDVQTSKTNFQQLIYKCEHAKILLSMTDHQDLDLASIDPVLSGTHLRLERSRVEKLCEDLLQRTFLLCDDTLRRANMTTRNIDRVVLSGGGCYMPVVRQGIEQYFEQAPHVPNQPDRLVAIGAALHAQQACEGR
ncbi:MAG: Hsp70 family protein [Myxococcota bacterium]